jgi:SAM-dependent methyltransferase
MPDARYDAVADFYAAGFDSTADSVSQALLDLLGPVTGARVLDVACGHGRITREIARRGATVTGVEISTVPFQSSAKLCGQADGSCSPSCTRVFPAGMTFLAPGPPMPAITTKDAGQRQDLVPRCATKSAPTTVCSRPT